MKTATRFAPSPTGFLHVGNLRTALIAWLYAKTNAGKFILRIDDTDIHRSKEMYIDALKEDLKWIGIDWDICFRQSDRLNKYEEVKQKLIDSGRLYACYETEEELAVKKKSLLSRNLPPIYDRSSLKLTLDEKKELEAKGVQPYWRFLLNEEEISWNDKIRGQLKFEAKNLSDPVLVRNDGTLTYSLASVVDDIEYAITDVIRGEDHISNSAIHIQLFKALSAEPPSFSHISLLTTKDKKLSKRAGDFSLKELREKGILPSSIAVFFSKIGSSDNIIAKKGIDHLIEEFSFSKLSKSTVQYDYNELKTFNAKMLHLLDFEEIQDVLQKLNIKDMDEEFWLSIRGNIRGIDDIKYWYTVCRDEIKTEIIDKELISLAKTLLPEEKFDLNTWDKWIEAIKAHTDLRGKKLFMPLRVALTGQEDGPELKNLLPMISKKLILIRLNK
ncbi:glutamate--tRNA ligase [Candidatus Bandiella numerosa]|uniref:glutamate--tRNA ligase n=1 Tax=Candidatus Bandiella numerosa TaxID=2570586 RepID=UPI001F0027F7|nr:glutamate--tRNA ligase [Candidatus Bandiella numerosa]